MYSPRTQAFAPRTAGLTPRTPITQPPHSAGLKLQGLRTHIEHHQIPSPIEAIEADRDRWETETFYTLPGTHVPLSTTDYVAMDQGNSSPKYIRLSTYSIPSTSKLAEELCIPLAAVVQPFADPDTREESVPLVEFGPEGPPRCAKCRAYINPWVNWTAAGDKWKCNLCAHETIVTPEYFSPLDNNLMRQDHAQRPELRKGTVDFAVTSDEYWASQPLDQMLPALALDPTSTDKSHLRVPAPMRFFVLLDVSSESIRSGFLYGACVSLKAALYGYTAEDGTVQTSPSFPSGCSLAILTFDDELHFYDLSPTQAESRMLVVPDIEEPYLPLPPSSVFVDPHESRTVIEHLLDSLVERFSEQPIGVSCFGSALQAGLEALAAHGGHIVSFVSVLPTIGLGALQPMTTAEESSVYDTSKEKQLYAPRRIEWSNLADQLAEAGIGASIFMAPSNIIDIASIGAVATGTGGEMFFYPMYKPHRDGPILGSHLNRLFSRTTGYNCSVRIRCSHGLRIDDYYGNFYMSGPATPTMGVLDADKAIACSFSVTRGLSYREYAHFQTAVLYTSTTGQRRVRVVNLAVQVAELAANVFRFADMDAVVSYLTRHSITRMKKDKLSAIRDELTEQCSAILFAYRKYCATGSVPTQLIIPEAFRGLPMYCLGIHKSKPLKGRSVTADVRMFHAHWLSGASVRQTMFNLYPRNMALHDLDAVTALPHPDTGIVEMPSLMRSSYHFMEAGGLYLIDNEELQVLWVGAAASPQLIQDVFGVDDISAVDPYMVALPELPTTLSQQVRNIIARRVEERGGRLCRLLIARQNMDASEIEFADLLVEDHNNAALAYTDYLSLVHKQITTAIQNGQTLTPSGNGGIRAPW